MRNLVSRWIFLSILIIYCIPLTEAFNTLQFSDSKIKVACIGNSITYGMNLKDRENDSYPAVLQNLLGDKYEVRNFGKNGVTLLYKGHRPYINQTEFHQALEFKPDIVVIHLGLNDTDPRDFPDYGDNFVKDYVSLVDSFKRENSKVRIILANLTPLHARHKRFKSGTRAWRDSIRKFIPEIAKITGSELIDFGEILKDRQNLLPDGIHPDKIGASLLSEAMFGAITGNYGGLKLPGIYGDRMVIQRYQPIKIKGKSNTGDTVVVKLGKNKGKSIADNQGRWEVELLPMKETIGLCLEISNGKENIIFQDVAVGEVWIASGQSNMEFKLRNITTAQEDLLHSQDSLLRLYNMEPVAPPTSDKWSEEQKQKIDELQYFKTSQWESSTPSTAGNFSAVGWHFGKMLRDSLNVPVGIVLNSVGGAPTEAWIDVETLEHNLPEILVDWRTNDYIQPWVQKRIEENVGTLQENGEHRHPYEPSYLFASGIRKLANYPIAGVIWYQGESNAHNIEVHESLFSSLLESWRNYFQRPMLPFLFVQLSSIDRPSWSLFRDSQRRLAENNSNVWMVVSSDLGDSLDVHPKNKRPVGERLGRQALNRVYSMYNVTPQGPLIRNAKLTGDDELTLFFDFSEGLKTSDGKTPGSFEIAGEEELFTQPEFIEIEKNKIIIKGMKIKKPQFVRYGWQPYTRSNLVNGEGLPATTFKISIDSNKDQEIEDGFIFGLSGALTGIIGGDLIIAGGCNFPENPLSSESQKRFYKGIYKLYDDGEGGWKVERIGTLPQPMAYAAVVTTPEGMIVIGGSNATDSFSNVYLLTSQDQNVEISTLPSLTFKMDNSYATYQNGIIYVAGGNINGQPSNRFFSLDINKPGENWKELKPFPGNPRVQPILANGKSSDGKDYIYIWGGFAGKGENREASLNTDGLRYDIKRKSWNSIETPKDDRGEEISTGGGASVVLPDGRIIVIGGVNKDIFLSALRNQPPDYLSHPVEWYRFNPYVLVFNPKTEQWSIAEVTNETARAGAGLVATDNNEIIVVGGEIKPRIRTSNIYKMRIDNK